MQINQLNTNKVEYHTASKKQSIKKEVTEEARAKKDIGIIEDTYEKSEEVKSGGTYTKPKKLTEEQVKALKENQAEQEKQMLKQMMAIEIGSQAQSRLLTSGNTFILEEVFGSMDAALPPLATTPEEAEAAISEGGAYSVDSVATRIMKLAEALAGDDLDKLQTMKEAVQKGFSEAGKKFGDSCDEEELPQICRDTYDEIMNRFDEWEKRLTN